MASDSTEGNGTTSNRVALSEAEILGHLRSSIFVLDAFGTIVQIAGNPDLLGFTTTGFVGRNALEIIAPDQIDDFASVFVNGGSHLVSNNPPPFPASLVAADGHRRDVECLARRTVVDGALHWVISVTPFSLQSFSYHGLDTYLAGGDPIEIATTVARRMATGHDGVRIEMSVLSDPVDGRFRTVTASPPDRPIATMMRHHVADTTAPWNNLSGRYHETFDLSACQRQVADAARGDGYAVVDVGIASIDGVADIALVGFGSHHHAFSGNVRILLDRALQMIELALEKSRADSILREAAERDPLTSLANRVRFGHVGATIAATAQGPVGVMYIDIDHFKSVNDTFGHTSGDEVLIEVARRISDAVRPDDLVARLGGDEFAVLLMDIDDEAAEIGRRIVEFVAAPLPEGIGPANVSASVGLAVARDADAALEIADLAMLEGKRAGRGKLVDATPVAFPSVLD